MNKTFYVICEYCGRRAPEDVELCGSCGAPIVTKADGVQSVDAYIARGFNVGDATTASVYTVANLDIGMYLSSTNALFVVRNE